MREEKYLLCVLKNNKSHIISSNYWHIKRDKPILTYLIKSYCSTGVFYMLLYRLKTLQQKFVKVVNNLVEKDELVAWSRMKEERREHTITKLLHTVEESALTLAGNYKTPAELEIKATEMGEIIISTERSHRRSNYIKLSRHSSHLCAGKWGFR